MGRRRTDRRPTALQLAALDADLSALRVRSSDAHQRNPAARITVVEKLGENSEYRSDKARTPMLWLRPLCSA